MPMSLEIYAMLGLHLQPQLEMNGRGSADFRQSLDHPDDAIYQPCAESEPHSAVSPGVVTSLRGWSESLIYPGTRRDIWVYQPANLDTSRPVNLIIFNDGGAYLAKDGPVRATKVLDTLHASGEIAPTVAVFINPPPAR